MYNPDIAKYGGISSGILIVGISYFAYAIYQAKRDHDSTESLIRGLLLSFFLGMSFVTNYYNAVVYGLYILSLNSALSISLDDNFFMKKALLEFGALFVISSAIYYLFPIQIYRHLAPYRTYDVFGISFVLSILVPPILAQLSQGNADKIRIKLFLAIYAPLATLALLLDIFGIASHVWYGLYIMVGSTLLLSRGYIPISDIDTMFLCGFLIMLDDVIGYLSYPEYGLPPTINELLPLILIAMTATYIKRRNHQKKS